MKVHGGSCSEEACRRRRDDEDGDEAGDLARVMSVLSNGMYGNCELLGACSQALEDEPRLVSMSVAHPFAYLPHPAPG